MEGGRQGVGEKRKTILTIALVTLGLARPEARPTAVTSFLPSLPALADLSWDSVIDS